MKRKKSYKTKRKPATRQNKEIIKESRKANRYLKGIGLVCQKCGVEIRVDTTRPELYTKELKESYICLNCRGRNKNG
jgi:hypothetical protein